MSNNTPSFNWHSLFSKDTLAWALLIANLIYGYAIRNATSDVAQRQQVEDHIVISDMRDKISQLTGDQKALAAKIDFLVQISFRNKPGTDK